MRKKEGGTKMAGRSSKDRTGVLGLSAQEVARSQKHRQRDWGSKEEKCGRTGGIEPMVHLFF